MARADAKSRSSKAPAGRRIAITRESLVTILIIIAGLGCGIGAVRWVSQRSAARKAALVSEQRADQPHLEPGSTQALIVSPATMKALDVRTAPVEAAESPPPLRLPGSLFLDSNRLVHVHTRFPGEVVQIGMTRDEATGEMRQLRANDRVEADQLLAVVWSKEIGEKKSDLADAMSQLWLSEGNLKRLKGLEPGVVPQRTVLEAERAYEANQIAVERAERTLRSWRLTDEEIEAVQAEARRIHEGRKEGETAQRELDRQWAELDLRAPLNGVVLEKNVARGDIVETTLDVFKIADLSRLAVFANVYDEDIPLLEALTPEERRWQVQVQGEPELQSIEGRFEVIGSVIDPHQHTGMVIGWVENKENRLRVGQFITAVIQLPAPRDQVMVPINAVIDRGGFSTVLVTEDGKEGRVLERKVKVMRRTRNHAFVQATAAPSKSGEEFEALMVGERVVTHGNFELAAALEELRSEVAVNK